MYVVLLSNTGFSLLTSQTAIGKIMGALILLFPIIGAWTIVVELKFGLATEKLCQRVETEGSWPDLGIEVRPSGRAVKSSADAAFTKWRDAAAEKPDDWHNWFNLSLAYDACADRRRARGAMRKAIALAKRG